MKKRKKVVPLALPTKIQTYVRATTIRTIRNKAAFCRVGCWLADFISNYICIPLLPVVTLSLSLSIYIYCFLALSLTSLLYISLFIVDRGPSLIIFIFLI